MALAACEKKEYLKVVKRPSGRALSYLPTVTALLESVFMEFGRSPAISDGKNTYTYSELYERVAIRRGFLRNRNIGLGNKVAVMATFSPDIMETFLAVTTNGSVCVMLPPDMPASGISRIAHRFGIKTVMCSEELKSKVVSAGVECLPVAFEKCGHYSAPAYDAIEGSLCAICLTDCSEKEPKGAVLTHGSLMRGAFGACSKEEKLLPRIYTALMPLSDIYGLTAGFLSCLYTGSLIYIYDDVRKAIKQIPDNRTDSLVMSPDTADQIFGILREKGGNYSAFLNDITVCGSHVPDDVIKNADMFGVKLRSVLGFAESGGAVFCNDDVTADPRSAGSVCEGFQYKTEKSELLIKGDSLMLGYYGDKNAASDTFDENGFFRTGYIAETEDGGRVFLLGKTENCIVSSGGENIYPEELENIFCRSPYIKRCRIKEDKIRNRKVLCAEIVPEEEVIKDLSAEEKKELLKNAVKSININLPKYKQVKKILIKRK